MLQKILSKFGFIKSPKNEDDFSKLYIDYLGDLFDYKTNKKEEIELFKRLAEVEGLLDYLQFTLVQDVQKYFKAQTVQQQVEARGAFARTLYLRSRIVAANKGKVDMPDTRTAT